MPGDTRMLTVFKMFFRYSHAPVLARAGTRTQRATQ
jgi:hypothetical protein